MKTVSDILLSVWWISWFGIIGSFLWIGGLECRYEISAGVATSRFSITLFIAMILLWSVFFAADVSARKRERVVVRLLTMAGTFLAIFTILGIFFFVDIAPRIRCGTPLFWFKTFISDRAHSGIRLS